MKSNPHNTLRYFENTDRVMTEIYYHYTSIGVLFSIVNKQSFWLTSLKSSNDKKELTYTYDRFLADLNSVIEEEDDDAQRLFLKKVYDSKDLVHLTKSAQKPNLDSYALCLSQSRDSLTHWERYTNGCKGVCLSINLGALLVLLKRRGLDCFASQLFDIKGIAYLERERHRFLVKTVFDVYNMVRFGKEEKEEDVDDIRLVLPLAYSEMKNFIKVDSFYDEDEIRLLYSSLSLNTVSKIIRKVIAPNRGNTEYHKEIYSNYIEMINNLEIKEKKYSVFSTGIRSYYNLCLKEVWGEGLIPEIILGPMCAQDKKELRAFLDANGLRGTKITESKVPIR